MTIEPPFNSRPYYEADGIQIWHGDCRDIDAWLAADVLVTDPPYGINHSERGKNEPNIHGEARTGRASGRTLTINHVAMRDAALRRWGPRPAMVFGNWRAPRPARTMMRLVWDKGIGGLGGVGAWRSADEEIYLADWPNPMTDRLYEPSVIRIAPYRGGNATRSNGRPDHPTPKPLSLMRYLIRHTPPGTIADPFMGSGSTLRAAKDLGRSAIGIEVEERYCEIAAKRLAQGSLFGTDVADAAV